MSDKSTPRTDALMIICSEDGKPCPTPLAGRGPGKSQCEQNGLCQRLNMDALPTLRADVQDGKLSLRVEPALYRCEQCGFIDNKELRNGQDHP